jgi:hypothetical protein
VETGGEAEGGADGGSLLRAMTTELGFRVVGGARPPSVIEEVVGRQWKRRHDGATGGGQGWRGESGHVGMKAEG